MEASYVTDWSHSLGTQFDSMKYTSRETTDKIGRSTYSETTKSLHVLRFYEVAETPPLQVPARVADRWRTRGIVVTLLDSSPPKGRVLLPYSLRCIPGTPEAGVGRCI